MKLSLLNSFLLLTISKRAFTPAELIMHCAKNFPFWASLVTITTYLVPTVYAHYAITGVKTGVDDSTGARPPRRNILDLQKDLPTWYALPKVIS